MGMLGLTKFLRKNENIPLDDIQNKKIKTSNQLPDGLTRLSSKDLVNALKKNKDAREVAYSMIVDYLIDPNNLLATSILKGDYPETIIKNLIVVEFFQNYYAGIQIKIKFTKIEEPPYYKRNINYANYREDMIDDLLEKYPQLIQNMLMITGSKDGIFRKQFLGILKASDDYLDMKDRVKSWIHERFQE